MCTQHQRTAIPRTHAHVRIILQARLSRHSAADSAETAEGTSIANAAGHLKCQMAVADALEVVWNPFKYLWEPWEPIRFRLPD